MMNNECRPFLVNSLNFVGCDKKMACPRLWEFGDLRANHEHAINHLYFRDEEYSVPWASWDIFVENKSKTVLFENLTSESLGWIEDYAWTSNVPLTPVSPVSPVRDILTLCVVYLREFSTYSQLEQIVVHRDEEPAIRMFIVKHSNGMRRAEKYHRRLSVLQSTLLDLAVPCVLVKIVATYATPTLAVLDSSFHWPTESPSELTWSGLLQQLSCCDQVEFWGWMHETAAQSNELSTDGMTAEQLENLEPGYLVTRNRICVYGYGDAAIFYHEFVEIDVPEYEVAFYLLQHLPRKLTDIRTFPESTVRKPHAR